MPGRTPQDAFRAFVEPLELAASVLGQVKITVSPGGRAKADQDHSWTLNGGAGYSRAGWYFEAAMMYRIIRDDREGRGPWRVTTLAYRYRLAVPDQPDLFRMHWHPEGNSPVKEPHMHLALGVGPLSVDEALKRHLPVPRQTFEEALRWAIELGMPPERDDRPELLNRAEEAHLRYRTWS